MLRRPIVFIFLSFISGIILQYYAGPGLLFLTLVGLIEIVLLAIFILLKSNNDKIGLPAKLHVTDMKKRIGRGSCFFLAFLILGSTFFYVAHHNKDPLENYPGQTAEIYGRVLAIQEKGEDYFSVTIKCSAYSVQELKDPSGEIDESVMDKGWKGKRLINLKGKIEKPQDLIGRSILITGKVELPSPRRNPKMFDYSLYLKTKGIRTILISDTAKMKVDGNNISRYHHSLATFKYGYIEKLKQVMDPDACGVFVGMLFGDVTDISDETYEAFQKNGIAHILSVSGIHVGIVYLSINKILGGGRSKLLNLAAILILVLYAALSEFSPSVVRAVVMIIIHILSKLTWRRYDFLACAASSALLMLLVNPYYLFNVGFQLSYLAVFCLSVLMPWANRRLDNLEEKIQSPVVIKWLKSVAPLVAIQLGMAPLTAYLFNYFSIASFFMNIPIIALSGVIIPIGICLIPLSFVGGIPFGVGAAASELLIKIMTGLNDFFFLPGVGFVNAVSPSLGLIILYYSLLFFMASEMLRVLYQRKKFTLITAITVIFVISSLAVATFIEEDNHKSALTFVDVGQGDCLHIRTPSGKNVLIDGGGSLNYDTGKKLLLPYLLKNKVGEIDLAVVTHLHDDHYLGLAQLARHMKINRMVTYEANQFREKKLLEETGLYRESMVYATAGQRIEIDKNIWIDILYPNKASEKEYAMLAAEEGDENRSSLFVKVNYEGLSILMTGDIGFDGEREIMKRYEDDPAALKCHLLKVGHHGSRYSTSDEFLEAVQPHVAVFQVGKNNYGHPHPDVIEKCEKKGIMIYRNDLKGAIIFNKEGKEWHIKTMLQ